LLCQENLYLIDIAVSHSSTSDFPPQSSLAPRKPHEHAKKLHEQAWDPLWARERERKGQGD